MLLVAIIDIGSNSIRLTIYDGHDPQKITIIHKATHFTRLSSGMNQTGRLAPDKMAEALAILAEFKQIMKEHNVTRYKAIATAAVRAASNQAYFIKNVAESTGIDITVISGLDEAYYDYLGVISGLPNLKDAVMVDTGGGSCEIVYIKDGKLHDSTSLQIGAVTLSDKFKATDYHWTTNMKEQLALYVHDEIAKVTFLNGLKGIPCVAVGGSNRSLMRVSQGNENSVQGCEMTKREVISLIDTITAQTIEERKKIIALGEKRAENIVAGLAPIKEIIQLIDSQKLIFSEKGLKEGVLLSILTEQ